MAINCEVITPKFSIIIPAYNAGKFIHRAINSVLNQSERDWELIIVENGSTDNTTVICENFLNDKRINLLHSEKGVSEARNTGMRLAKGKWLIFLDADDQLLDDTLQKYAEIDEVFSPDLIVGEYEDKSVKYNSEIKVYQNDNLRDFTCISLESPTQKCNTKGNAFRNTIVKQYNVSFDKQIKFAEDSIFFLEVLKYSKKIVTIFYPLYRVVYYSQSTVRSGKRKLDKEYLPAINKISTILEISDPYIRNEWYIFILNQLLVVLVNDVFARAESVFRQMEDAECVMNIPEYKTAIGNVDLSTIRGLKKFVFRMMKMNSMFGICLAVKARQLQNKKKEDKFDV